MVVTNRWTTTRSDSTNPFALIQQIDSTVVNGELWRTVSEAATQRFTAPRRRARQALPSNDSSVVTNRRTTTRSDSTNPFAVTQQIDSTLVNGELWRTVFQANIQRFTSTTPEGRQAFTTVDSLGRVRVVRTPGSPFTPATARDAYQRWPSLPDLLPAWFPGIGIGPNDAFLDTDHDRLIERMRLERAILTRNLLRYYHGPFDQRYLYWVPEVDSPEARQYRRHIHEANGWLAMRRTPLRDWSPPYFSTALGSSWVMGGPTAFFPMHLGPEPGISALRKSSSDQPGSLNLSQRALAVAGELGAVGPVPFYHTLAILHSPRYRQEHADALLLDWPRVPVPAEREAFVCSAEVGYRVAAELSMEWEWETYAEGPRPGVLRGLARLTREDGGVPDPDAGELDLTAGWGPVERSYTEEERSALGAAVTLLGDSTFDVRLNRRSYWKNVPSRVWRYTLGGHQVMKEWLRARDRDLLRRSLTAEEVRYAEEMTRRIAGILLMEPALDANYEAVRRNAYAWPEAGSAPG